MKKLVISTLLLIAALTTASAAEKYAVLITGDYAGKNIPDAKQWNGGYGKSDRGFDEFWNDTYLMWEQLRLKGYKDENIFVLFANGVDYTVTDPFIHTRYNPNVQKFPTVPRQETITDLAATKGNVQAVFNQLRSKAATDDFLFVWTFDHGGSYGNNQSYINLMGSDRLEDYHLKYLSDNITANKKVFWMQRYNAQLVTDH